MNSLKPCVALTLTIGIGTRRDLSRRERSSKGRAKRRRHIVHHDVGSSVSNQLSQATGVSPSRDSGSVLRRSVRDADVEMRGLLQDHFTQVTSDQMRGKFTFSIEMG